ETAIEHVLDALEVKGIKPAIGFKRLEAAARIDQLRKCVDLLDLKSDEKRAAELAIGYANTLRERRNHGSHTKPKFPFDDHHEVEEMIVSGGRHLPALWSLTKAPVR